jgi:hypothetical protein
VKRALGWIPDRPDRRDRTFAAPRRGASVTRFDMRPDCPAVYNQLDLGSCVAQAAGFLVHYSYGEVGKIFKPATLKLYGDIRIAQGTFAFDSGGTLRGGAKALNRDGVCRESLHPYVVSNFRKRPSAAAIKESLAHRVNRYAYARVDGLDALRNTLADDNPIMFGFSVYDSFDQVGRDGLVPMPKAGERVNGGHAVALVGFDDSKRIGSKRGAFIVRNSWGPRWGDKGYCYMPYDFVLDPKISSDFWTVLAVAEAATDFAPAG